MSTKQAISFGSWVMQKRGTTSRHHYASLLQMDFGTLKRTEEDQGDVQLSTAVRLCQGIGVSLDTLLKEWLHTTLPSSKDADIGAVLTQQDVLRWMHAVIGADEQARSVLAAVMNRVAAWNGGMYLEGTSIAYLFHENDIEKLLRDLPWLRFEVAFPDPPSMTLESLWQCVQRNGPLLQTEIGSAITHYREQQRIAMQRWSEMTQLAPSVLLSFERGTAKYIKLQDVLHLDEACGQRGIVLALYWYMESFKQLVVNTSVPTATHFIRARPVTGDTHGKRRKMDAMAFPDVSRLACCGSQRYRRAIST